MLATEPAPRINPSVVDGDRVRRVPHPEGLVDRLGVRPEQDHLDPDARHTVADRPEVGFDRRTDLTVDLGEGKERDLGRPVVEQVREWRNAWTSCHTRSSRIGGAVTSEQGLHLRARRNSTRHATAKTSTATHRAT